MENPISQRVQRWASEEKGEIDFNALHAEIEYLALKRFESYVPTFGPFRNFRSRFAKWLENDVTEEDRKILFRLVPHIFFVGREEFAALQRAAFQGPLARWLIDVLHISLDDSNLQTALEQGARETWFCPITDSADITDFYHVNRIAGVEHRFEWRAFATLMGGDSSKLQEYMATEGRSRVVLIEDIVGSGNQMSDLKPLFDSLPATVPVLLCPLIVCPKGAEVGRHLATCYTNVRFDPVLELPNHSFVAAASDPNEPAFFTEVRDLIQRIYPSVSSGGAASAVVKPYGPFGWRETGALIVSYTNTPDNTLPVIQHTSQKWSPLFPRSSRID
jgi:hypothetical protein